MAIHIVILCALFGSRLNQSLKHWTKPTTASLAVGTLADMTRSRRDLVAESALLRQQLIVLRRQVKRPDLTNSDRIQLLLLARFTRYWQYSMRYTSFSLTLFYAGIETCSTCTGDANREKGSEGVGVSVGVTVAVGVSVGRGVLVWVDGGAGASPKQ
jgi:hypothetical protein